jgi:hypothetical protein
VTHWPPECLLFSGVTGEEAPVRGLSEHLSEAQLASLVTRDSMVGVTAALAEPVPIS